MNRRLIGLSLGVALILGSLFFFASPRFDKSDDTALAMTFAGTAISLRPEARTAALHVWVGQVLTALFAWKPHVPWYTLALLLCQYLFYVAAAYTVAMRPHGRLRLVLFFVYLVVVQATVWLHPSYTSSAFYLSAAGIFLILHAEWDGKSPEGRRKFQAWGLLLILVGSLFRWNASLLAVIELVPLWAMAALGTGTLKKRGGEIALLGLVAVSGVYALYRADLQYYKQDPNWASYNEICGLLYEFHDYGTIPYGSGSRSLFQAAGWTDAEQFLLYYNFIDGKRLGSIPAMKKVLAALPHRSKLSGEMTRDLMEIVFSKRVVWYAIALAAVTLAMFSISLHSFLFFGAFAFWVGGIVLGVASLMKFSAPVAMPPLLILPIVFLGWVGEPRSWWRKRRWGWGLVAVALVLCVWRVRAYRSLSLEDDRVATEMTEAFQSIQVGAQDLLVGWTTMDIERLSAFHDLKVFFGSRQMVGVGGIGAQLPFQLEILERHGIRDIYQALAENSNLILLSDDKKNRALGAYLMEQFGTERVFHPLVQSSYFGAFRLLAP